MKDNCFTRPRWLLWLAAVAWLMTSPAQADPAGRIGRVAWLSGTLNLYNPDSGESFSAPRNQPLTSGDVLSTAPGTRAEIQIGALTVRLDANSSLDLSRIDDEQIRLALNGGRLIVKLPSRDALNDFELTTRDGRFNAREPGVYRVDTDANSTVATAYYGALHFTASDSEVEVGAGQRLQFWYSGQTLHRRLSAANDDFAQWSAARDQRPASASAARYVSPEMTGAEDLDDYGDWSQSAEYGAIWTPRGVAAGWAPYQTGHWAWVAPWGWNWVGDEPWGFAPFHYGRWVQHRSAWAWVPGARSERPVYAPALVGWNARHGVAPNRDARPTSGWFPLGAREVYVPAYRSSENYAHRVNVPHRSPHDRAVIDPRSPAAAPRQESRQESRRTMPGAPAGAPQRSERAQPESFRPAPVPQLAPVETRDRREHQDQAFGRRESERVAPTDRHDPLPAPRERPQPEAVRPVMRDPRGEAPPQAARQTAPQRVDTPPQAMREQRHEPPAAVIRPQGAEARPQRNEERQRPASNAQERRHRDDGERR